VTYRVTYDEVEVGDALPPWSRTTAFMHWNRYAAANDEFVPFHMEDSAGLEAGGTGAFGMGNLRHTYLVNAVRDWAGDEAELREVGCQYRAFNYRDDVLTCTGRIVEKRVEGRVGLVRLELAVTNQDGAVVAPGQALVALPLSRAAVAEGGGAAEGGASRDRL
jgi:acyl dehydratase